MADLKLLPESESRNVVADWTIRGSLSPMARQDIRLDITDLYVFRSETGTALVINVCHSIFGAIPVPGYHPEGMYEFKVDLNGDAVEDLAYRITFKERDQHGKQSYVVQCLKGADAVDLARLKPGASTIAQDISFAAFTKSAFPSANDAAPLIRPVQAGRGLHHRAET